ncbi:hypothetical protein Rs2_41526 [Raphanus sativus]|nr:hypothetical protein Rs2_41526 [Raphanus sativus]
MVLRERYAILERGKVPRTLKVGSTMLLRETRAPFCRVVGYIFGLGYEKKPLYIVTLESESDFQLPLGTRLPLIHDESVEYIDEEDLFKIFHDPVKTDITDEEEEVNDCQSTTAKKRRMSTNEQEIINSNHCEPSLTGQNNFNQLQPHHMDLVPNQLNQMGSVPTLLPSQASVMMPMMYNQQHGFRSSQLTEPNLGTQVPTMLVGQHNLRQPFGMSQQPFLNATAPMVYNPPQQFMRPEVNQPNQMGIVPNPLPVQAPMMYNQQYCSQITEPNLGAQVSSTMFLGQNNPNQPFGMRQQPFQIAPAPVMYNRQQQSVTNQQNQMSSMTMRMFNGGQSSYRGRGVRCSRARGLGRRGRD